MVLLHLHCPSGAPLRYAVCHTSCSSYGICHGSYCVLHATSFISSSVPLHYTSFVANPFASRLGIPCQQHRSKAQWECTSLSQASPTILTGFHFAALRHSFTSVAFSPPAAHNLACLAACHSYGFVMVFVRHTLADENKNTCQTLASHCCCLSPFHGFLASTVAGARSQFQSFLLPLAFGGTPLGYSVDKCATRLCFFLAAGAITFCRHTGYN